MNGSSTSPKEQGVLSRMRSATGFGSPRGPRRRRLLSMLLAVAVLIAAVFLWTRPDLPPRTDLEGVSNLVAENRVSRLALQGNTLTVTLTDGSRVRVEGVDVAQAAPIQEAAIARSPSTIEATYEPSTIQTQLVMLAISLMPVGLLVVLAIIVAQLLRGSRLHR